MCFTKGVWLDDDGTYICEAKNRFGSIQTEARISVTGLGMLSSAISLHISEIMAHATNCSKSSWSFLSVCVSIKSSCRAASLGPRSPGHHHGHRPVSKHSLYAAGWNTTSGKILVPKWKTCRGDHDFQLNATQHTLLS